VHGQHKCPSTCLNFRPRRLWRVWNSLATTVTGSEYVPFASFEQWRSASLADAVWNQYSAALTEERNVASQASLQRAVDEAIRTAAIETGAIEGLYSTSRGTTQTIAVQATAWEAVVDEMGDNVRGHFEAQLHAFEMVLDLATQATPVTEAWMRELHHQVCANQTTYRALTEVGWQDVALLKGQYKKSPNHVVTSDGEMHYCAPVEDTALEMARLVNELRSDDFAVAAPVIQAAYAHHAFVSIHPFSDGNGRVSRALASVYLYRAANIPLIIYSDQQVRYWQALSSSDHGDYQAFVTFIEDRAIDAMATVTSSLRSARRSGAQAAASTLRQAIAQHEGLSPAELEAIANRLADAVSTGIASRLAKLAQDGSLPADVRRSQSTVILDDSFSFWGNDYHLLRNASSYRYELRILGHKDVTVMGMPTVGLASDSRNRFAFILVDGRREVIKPVFFRVSDLNPEISASARVLIDEWIEEAIQMSIEELVASLED